MILSIQFHSFTLFFKSNIMVFFRQKPSKGFYLLHPSSHFALYWTVIISDELFLAFVKSTEAHAEIVSIDTTEALASTGIFGIVDIKDIKENQLDLYNIFPDQKVIAFNFTEYRNFVLSLKVYMNGLLFSVILDVRFEQNRQSIQECYLYNNMA